MNPLSKKLDALLKSNPNPSCVAAACKVNLATGEIAYSYSNKETPDQFKKSVLASGSIPFFMSPIDGVWVDGGVRQQTPLKQAILDGCTQIIVILVNPWSQNPTDTWAPGGKFLAQLSVGIRAIDVMEHEVFVTDIETCLGCNSDPSKIKIDLTVYAPPKLIMDTLDFDPAKIREGINLGVNAQPIAL
jgi:predicted acylesterase/phospholipase RssA